MKQLTIDEKINIVNNYTIQGVPESLLKKMCRDARISYPKLMKELTGQTMALVGNEGVIYPSDIIRFIKNLPVID